MKQKGSSDSLWNHLDKKVLLRHRESSLFLRVSQAQKATFHSSQTQTRLQKLECESALIQSQRVWPQWSVKKLLCSSRALCGFGRSPSTPSRTPEETLIVKVTLPLRWKLNNWVIGWLGACSVLRVVSLVFAVLCRVFRVRVRVTSTLTSLVSVFFFSSLLIFLVSDRLSSDGVYVRHWWFRRGGTCRHSMRSSLLVRSHLGWELLDPSSGPMIKLVEFKGIVHFEIKIWYLSAYPKGIQDVGVFFSSVDPILIFLGQTVVVCQSYNGRYRSRSL